MIQKQDVMSIHCSMDVQIKILKRAKYLILKHKCDTLCRALMTALVQLCIINTKAITHKKDYAQVIISKVTPIITHANAVEYGNAIKDLDETGLWWTKMNHISGRNIKPRIDFLDWAIDTIYFYNRNKQIEHLKLLLYGTHHC